MTPGEQLASLPETVQAELWKVVRTAAGMDTAEKTDALSGLTGVAEAYLAYAALRGADSTPVLEFTASLGELLQALHHQANPHKEAV
jgi:hypothetical protein